jgi:hypothetical protein
VTKVPVRGSRKMGFPNTYSPSSLKCYCDKGGSTSHIYVQCLCIRKKRNESEILKEDNLVVKLLELLSPECSVIPP